MNVNIENTDGFRLVRTFIVRPENFSVEHFVYKFDLAKAALFSVVQEHG